MSEKHPEAPLITLPSPFAGKLIGGAGGSVHSRVLALGEAAVLLEIAPEDAGALDGRTVQLELALPDGRLLLDGVQVDSEPDAAGAFKAHFGPLTSSAYRRVQAFMTEIRKGDHIRICRDEPVDFSFTAGFDRYRLPHHTLPEVDLNEISLKTTFLGRPLNAPLLISCMTGGSEEAGRINQRLARAAQATGVALGLGSMRILLENPEALASFDVRRYAPDVLLLANIGVVQLNYGVGLAELEQLVDMVGADVLVFHSNPLQEAIQPEGDVNFKGLKAKLSSIVTRLSVPAILKEIGFGISGEVARDAVMLGFQGIDVAGSGGTSWALVEGMRSRSAMRQALGRAFANWGIPTVDSLKAVKDAAPGLALIASGGVRSGQDILKALALGANLGGMARPFLKAACRSTEACIEEIVRISAEIRIAMFCGGIRSVAESTRLQLTAI